MRGAYCASVLSADHYVGEVLRASREYGLDARTIIVFTSDHGEELFDHVLLGHAGRCTRSSCMSRFSSPDRACRAACGFATPVTNRASSGRSRSAAARPSAPSPRASTCSRRSESRRVRLHFTTETGWWWNAPRSPIHGVLAWPWVLHVAPRGLAWGSPKDAYPGAGQVRLYDLEHDPGERIDRALERKDLAAKLARGPGGARARVDAVRTEAAVAGEGTHDLLRRIGYTGDGK
jgi:arylsulfatase A-like enzyme